MSDFLTNLVVRSFSPTTAVQPVGANFYSGPEPPRDPVEEFGDPFAESFIEAPAPADVEQAEPSRKQQPKSVFIPEDFPSPSVSQLTEPSLPTDPAERKKVTDIEPSQAADVPITKPVETMPANAAVTKPADVTAVSRAPVIDPQPTLRRLMRRPASAVSLSPQVSSSRVAQSRVAPSRVDQSRVEQPSVKQPHVEQSRTEQPQRRTTKPTELPIVERVVERTQSAPTPAAGEGDRELEQTIVSFTTLMPKTSTQALLPVSFKSRANVQPEDRPEEPAAEAPPETVINVAIGRIEVRATSAPAPKRERQAGPKVMNLDDYMQQRSRGAQ